MRPSIPGIFRPVALPEHAAERHVALTLESPGLTTTHDLGIYRVYPDQASAVADQPPKQEAGDEIGFLKEQQWKVDFATAAGASGERSMPRFGPPASSRRARTARRWSAPRPPDISSRADAFPRIGTRVSAGQPLATILPKVAGDQVDVASLELAVERARSEHGFARARARAPGAARRPARGVPAGLNEAENAERVAKAERSRRPSDCARYRRTLGGDEATVDRRIQVRAPIAGTLVEILVAAGSS